MEKIPEYCEINDTHLKNIFHSPNYPWGETKGNLKKCCFYTFLFIYSVDFHGGNPRKFSDSPQWNPLAARRMFVARKDKNILFIHGPETKNFSFLEMITLKIEFTSCVCINFVLMLSYEREKVDKRQTGYLAKINRNETYFEYMKAHEGLKHIFRICYKQATLDEAFLRCSFISKDSKIPLLFSLFSSHRHRATIQCTSILWAGNENELRHTMRWNISLSWRLL